MRILVPLISLIITLFPTPILGQSTQEEFINNLIKKENVKHKSAFDKSIEGIVKVCLANEVYTTYITKVRTSLKDNDKLNKIAKIINPSDSSLTGKSYTTFIRETAESTFIDNSDLENKDRIKSVLNNLTNKNINSTGSVIGSIIEGFASSSPVLNLATNVISGLGTFFKSRTGEVKGVKEKVVTSIKESISASKLKEFKDKITVHSQFYDNALNLNIKFGAALELLIEEASYNDSLAKIAVQDLKLYGQNAVNVDVTSLSKVQSKFSYDFEKLYFGDYDPHFYQLVSKAYKVDSLYYAQKTLDKRAQKVIDQYVITIEKMANKFTSKIKKKSNQVQVALIESREKEFKFVFNSDSLVNAFADNQYQLAFEQSIILNGGQARPVSGNASISSSNDVSLVQMIAINAVITISLLLIGMYILNKRIRKNSATSLS
jgi:hypothetical protein